MERLSSGPRGRRDSDWRAHPDHRRLLRRGDDRASVSPGAQFGERARNAPARSGPRTRPETPDDFVEMLPSLSPRTTRETRLPLKRRRKRPPSGPVRPRSRPPKGRTPSRTSRSPIVKSTRCTRSRRRWARASAYPTRWRSSRRSSRSSCRGQAARCFSTMARTERAPMPVRGRRRCAAAAERFPGRRRRAFRVGREKPAIAHQRGPAGNVPRGRDRRVDRAERRHRLPAVSSRMFSLAVSRSITQRRTITPKIIAGCSNGSPSRRAPSSITRSSSNKRRKTR